MINHVRTLLMNKGRDGNPIEDFGEEYIPSDFIPKRLSIPLATVNRTLFGGNPDRLFINYRMRQIMALMHSTDLSQDVLATDSRVTYLPMRNDLFDDAFKIAIKRIAGPALQVYVRGEHLVNMGSGIVHQMWDVEVLENDQVRVLKRREPFQESTTTVNYDDGLSTPVTLLGSELTVQFPPAPVGYRLQIESNARPQLDVAELLNQLSISFGERGVSEVFPPLAPEPFATWFAIYNTHPLAVYRFTALLLAIAARIEQMPQEVT